MIYRKICIFRIYVEIFDFVLSEIRNFFDISLRNTKYLIYIYMKCPILIFILISKNIKDIKNISNKNYHLFEMSLNKSAKLNVDYFDINRNLYF